jgi:hypothetical protein
MTTGDDPGRGTTHEGEEPRPDRWNVWYAPGRGTARLRADAWRGAGFECRGARVGLGKLRGPGTACGLGTEHWHGCRGGAARGARVRRHGVERRLARTRFVEPLFEHDFL